MAERRQLTARSVLASTLLGVSPPLLPTRSLVATAELLGVAPGTARVALSRMVASGELESTDDGYRLVSPALLARQDRQARSRRAETHPWSGDWSVFVVNAEPRPAAERVALRAAMAQLRHQELRDGVWLRPANLPERRRADLPAPDDSQGVGSDLGEEAVYRQCTVFTARPDDPDELAARLWDLRGWSAGAAALLDDLQRLGGRLDAGDTDALAEAFVVSADVLRHLQTDPLLPDELLPDDWPGPVLRTTYDAYDRSFRDLLQAWQRRRR